MKKILIAFAVLFLFTKTSFAQIDVGQDTTAIGLGATSTAPWVKGTYQGHSIPYYGLGWFADTDFPNLMAYFAGYGGVKFFAAGLPRMTITNPGNVGIGTTSPNARLEVQNGSSGANILVSNTVGGYALLGISSNVASVATLNFTNSLSLSGGPVGIGTTSPTRQLEVVSGTGVGPLRVSGPNGYLLIDNVGSGQSFYQANSFHQFQGASGNPILTMYNGGNVAIGTTDPKGYKLAVAGDAIAESMTVDLQGNWPDYTFKKEYHLMPLADLKTYVDKNQHLPEIPSAAQVEKDGINLGEMNRLLLKKVEELTLYLIEQQKEIDQLKKKVEHR